MITCPHCKPRRRTAWDLLPRSRVVETRKVQHRVLYRGEHRRVVTVSRLRECLGCRYRWRTLETVPQGRVSKKKLVRARKRA